MGSSTSTLTRFDIRKSCIGDSVNCSIIFSKENTTVISFGNVTYGHFESNEDVAGLGVNIHQSSNQSGRFQIDADKTTRGDRDRFHPPIPWSGGEQLNTYIFASKGVDS